MYYVVSYIHNVNTNLGIPILKCFDIKNVFNIFQRKLNVKTLLFYRFSEILKQKIIIMRLDPNMFIMHNAYQQLLRLGYASLS